MVKPEKEGERSCSAASWVEKNAYTPCNLTAILTTVKMNLQYNCDSKRLQKRSYLDDFINNVNFEDILFTQSLSLFSDTETPFLVFALQF